MPSKLFTVSTEILVEIVSLLPSQDIITCSRTCRRLRILVLDTPLLQYLTYAHRAGVEDNLPPGLTIPDRFARLRQWEEAWNNLEATAPTGRRLELKDQPSMRRKSMLRDGFLILACFQYEPGDAGAPGFFLTNLRLRSPATFQGQTEIYREIFAFDLSIEQNMIAFLHKVDHGEKGLQLSLWPFDDDLCTDVSKVWNINHVIRGGYGCMSWMDVDLKIVGEFVAIMTCGTLLGHADSFTLVDWKAKDAYDVLNSPSHTYAPSFCFLDHDTVALVNRRDKTIETHKILRTDDGEAYMKRFGVFKIPLVTDDLCDFYHAQWNGGYPSIPVSSPVVWPEDFEHPPSRLPFQSSLKSSVVSLSLFYLPTERELYGECGVRLIVPRAKLLDPQYDWTESSFRLFPLDKDVQEECTIAGTRWINEGLEVFDFNEARVQRALVSMRAGGSAVGLGLPNPVVEATDIQARSWIEGVPSSLPFCHTTPVNQRNKRYDDVLADDEHVVGIRYERKQGDYGSTTDIIVDVWTLY